MNQKQKDALQKVVDKFESGELAPIIRAATIELPPEHPAAKWTWRNRLLAALQSGYSPDCMGYNQWKEYGRQVKKGSRCVYILRPRIIKEEVNGREKERLAGYGYIPVFNVGSTEGDDLPWHLEPHEPPPLLDVAKAAGIEVRWGPLLKAYGVYRQWTDTIEIGTSDNDPATFFHELAHAIHGRVDGNLSKLEKEEKEVIAEFIAAVLMELYGLRDHSGNAWSYIRGYSKDPFKAVMKAMGKIEEVLDYLFSLQETTQAGAA